MFLPFLRVDGSKSPSDDSPVTQVVGVELRPGRLPVSGACLDHLSTTDHGEIVVLSWVCADGEVEAINVTDDHLLIEAFGHSGSGLGFSQFDGDRGFEAGVQVLRELPPHVAVERGV